MSSTLKKICADKKISGDGKSDQAYRENVEKSFCSPEFSHSISLLAYVEGKVVGRIDSGIIATTLKALAKLIWIGSAF